MESVETYDVPCVKDWANHPTEQHKLQAKAFEWLSDYLVDYAIVRIKSNPHDFGSYPSFEIFPKFEYAVVLDGDPMEEEDYNDTGTYQIEQSRLYDEFQNKMRELYTDYANEFGEYL